jgi:hypothetical protein
MDHYFIFLKIIMFLNVLIAPIKIIAVRVCLSDATFETNKLTMNAQVVLRIFHVRHRRLFARDRKSFVRCINVQFSSAASA